MPAEEQVVQIYAATNGYLDRITVDKVERFLAELIGRVRANESGLLEEIAGGNWDDDVQTRVAEVVRQFAEDFGFDLDEEGHPLEEGVDVEEKPRGSRTDGDTGPSEGKEERAS